MSDASLGMLSAAVTDLAARVEALDARVGRDGRSGEPAAQSEGRLRAVESVLTEPCKAVSKLARTDAAKRASSNGRAPTSGSSAVPSDLCLPIKVGFYR